MYSCLARGIKANKSQSTHTHTRTQKVRQTVQRDCCESFPCCSLQAFCPLSTLPLSAAAAALPLHDHKPYDDTWIGLGAIGDMRQLRGYSADSASVCLFLCLPVPPRRRRRCYNYTCSDRGQRQRKFIRSHTDTDTNARTQRERETLRCCCRCPSILSFNHTRRPQTFILLLLVNKLGSWPCNFLR